MRSLDPRVFLDGPIPEPHTYAHWLLNPEAECDPDPGVHCPCSHPCLCLQGVLHHHGEVGDQHQGRGDLAEPGPERVHPDPL